MIRKQDPLFCYIQETHLFVNRHFLQEKEQKKTQEANGPKKPAGVYIAFLISDKMEYQLIKRDREGHYILTKGKKIYQENISINIYAPNSKAPKLTKNKKTKQNKTNKQKNTTTAKITHGHSHTKSGRLPPLVNRQVIQTKTKQRNYGVK